MGTVTTAGGCAVTCGSCQFAWNRAAVVSDYERQDLESRPCPVCGAYTLSCTEPKGRPTRRERRDAARPHRAA